MKALLFLALVLSAVAGPSFLRGQTQGLLQVQAPQGVSAAFELDGDQNDNLVGSSQQDWDTVSKNKDVWSYHIQRSGAKLPSFVQGTKDVNDIPSWRWRAQSVPNKDFITNLYVASFPDDTITFACDFQSPTGDLQVGFWFFQENISPVQDTPETSDQPASGHFSGKHHDGDIFVTAEFQFRTSNIPQIKVKEWRNGALSDIASLDGYTGSWLCNSDLNQPACAITNGADINPILYARLGTTNSDQNIDPANNFFEGAINLKRVWGNNIPCYRNFMATTRASHSDYSEMKDLVGVAMPFCNPQVSATCPQLRQSDDHFVATMTVTVANNGQVSFPSVVVTSADGGSVAAPAGSSLSPGESATWTVSYNVADNLEFKPSVTVSFASTSIEDIVVSASCPPAPQSYSVTMSCRLPNDPFASQNSFGYEAVVIVANSQGGPMTCTIASSGADAGQDAALAALSIGTGLAGQWIYTVSDHDSSAVTLKAPTVSCKVGSSVVSDHTGPDDATCPDIKIAFEPKQSCTARIGEDGFKYDIATDVDNKELAPLYDCDLDDPLSSEATEVFNLPGNGNAHKQHTITVLTAELKGHDILVSCQDSGGNKHTSSAVQEGTCAPDLSPTFTVTVECGLSSDPFAPVQGSGYRYEAAVTVANPYSGPLVCVITSGDIKKNLNVGSTSTETARYEIDLGNGAPLPTPTVSCKLHGVDIGQTAPVGDVTCPVIPHNVVASKDCSNPHLTDGEQFQYHITVTASNGEASPLFNCKVYDPLSSATPAGDLGSLAAHANGVAEYNVIQDASVQTNVGTLVDQDVTVTCEDNGGDKHIAIAGVTGACTAQIHPALSITKSCSATLRAGGLDSLPYLHFGVDFTGTVTNNGDVTITGLALQDEQEDEFVSVTLSSIELAPGASATFADFYLAKKCAAFTENGFQFTDTASASGTVKIDPSQTVNSGEAEATCFANSCQS